MARLMMMLWLALLGLSLPVHGQAQGPVEPEDNSEEDSETPEKRDATQKAREMVRKALQEADEFSVQQSGPWKHAKRTTPESARVMYFTASAHDQEGMLDWAAFDYLKLQARFPFSAHAPDSLLRAAMIKIRKKEYEQARNLLRERRRRYPNAVKKPILDVAYKLLGDYYMDIALADKKENNEQETEKQTFEPKVKLSKKDALFRARELYEEMLEMDRLGRQADQAVYQLGLIEMEFKSWDYAMEHFKRLLRTYKHSSWRPEAEAQIAKCLLMTHSNPERNSDSRLEALARLNRAEIEANARGTPLTVKTRPIREEINRIEAEKLWQQASFYRKLHHWTSAEQYLITLLEEHALSVHAADARKILKSLKAKIEANADKLMKEGLRLENDGKLDAANLKFSIIINNYGTSKRLEEAKTAQERVRERRAKQKTGAGEKKDETPKSKASSGGTEAKGS